MRFKAEHALEERQLEAERVRTKFPGRVPVICESFHKSTLQDIDKKKYLVPGELTCGQFLRVIRARMRLPSQMALCLVINGSMVSTAATLASLDERYRDKDGLLYLSYYEEAIFG